jgi:hypothetical protein
MRPNVVVLSSNPQQTCSRAIPCLLRRVAHEQSTNVRLCSFTVNKHVIRRDGGAFLDAVCDSVEVLDSDHLFCWSMYD